MIPQDAIASKVTEADLNALIRYAIEIKKTRRKASPQHESRPQSSSTSQSASHSRR